MSLWGAIRWWFSARGFSLTTRSGGQVNAGATLDIPITLTVENLATEITVSDSVSLAASKAPSGNTLDTVSARTEITQDFIKNFMSPTADYAEIVNLAPGTYSLNPQRDRARSRQDVLPGLLRRPVHHDLRWHSV